MGREQMLMLWCIISVTDITAAMWNAAGNDIGIEAAGESPPPCISALFWVLPFAFPNTQKDILRMMLRLQSLAEVLFLICNAIRNPRADTWNDSRTHRCPTVPCWKLTWLLFNGGLVKCLHQTNLLGALLSNWLHNVQRTGFKNFNIAE